jgi:signal transduction histidine kinase
LEGRIEIDIAEDDGHCVFTVADDGPGVPESRRPRIFRLFQRLSSSEDGTLGIGLALSKRLVEAQGGRIALEASRLGHGATFRVWWPRFERKRVDG